MLTCLCETTIRKGRKPVILLFVCLQGKEVEEEACKDFFA